MSATLQEAQDRMFEAMEVLCATSHDVCVLDPTIDVRTTVHGIWLRSDGTSIGYTQTKPNELTFTLQVPMDAILGVPDDIDPTELVYKDNQ